MRTRLFLATLVVALAFAVLPVRLASAQSVGYHADYHLNGHPGLLPQNPAFSVLCSSTTNLKYHDTGNVQFGTPYGGSSYAVLRAELWIRVSTGYGAPYCGYPWDVSWSYYWNIPSTSWGGGGWDQANEINDSNNSYVNKAYLVSAQGQWYSGTSPSNTNVSPTVCQYQEGYTGSNFSISDLSTGQFLLCP